MELQEIKIKSITTCEHSECEINCSICYESLNTKNQKKILHKGKNWSHKFHKKCIDRWFKKEKDSCPMCRLKII